MAVPKKTSTTSDVLASSTAKLTSAWSASEKWVKPTISGPKSVQKSVCVPLIDKWPPSHSKTLDVPGLSACITNCWSKAAPPSGTRDKASDPGSTPSPPSYTVASASGLTTRARGAICGFVTDVFPYSTASDTPANTGISPTTKLDAASSANTRPNRELVHGPPSIKRNPDPSKN